MSITTKRPNLPKWHPTPAPPPSPKILNLPRRHSRKQPKKASAKPRPSAEDCRGKLECLFDQEQMFPRTVPTVYLDSAIGESERRERVGGYEEKGEFSEEKWRFQAEILRAECNFLRIERDFALKNLERNRVQMGRTLQSAIQTLITGRNKIYSGKSASSVLEEEIEVLARQLKELQGCFTVEDFEVQNCCNLDKKAILLQRRLKNLGGFSIEKCLKEICNVAEERFWMNISCENDDGSFVSGHKSNDKFTDESMSNEWNKCSGHCKAIVPRIVEQVRAETEQWSQMQEMLRRVRDKMEELQASRDFWQDQALDYDKEIQSLRSAVEEWRQKSDELQTKMSELKVKHEKLRIEEVTRAIDFLSISHDSQIEKDKHVVICGLKEICQAKENGMCGLKENCQTKENGSKLEILKDDARNAGLVALKQSPFQDIGNASVMMR